MAHDPTPPTEAPSAREGQGGETPATRAEARMIGRAARERWKISEQARENAVRRLNMIIFDEKAGDRSHIGAVRALAALDRLNLESEQLEILRNMEARLERLERPEEGGVKGLEEDYWRPGSA